MQGINFKEPLFHATIEGWKTQTRRIMVPQPQDCTLDHVHHEDQPMRLVFGSADGGSGGVYCPTCGNGICIGNGKPYLIPRYKVGAVIYLKEPYRLESRGAGVYEIHYQFGGAPKLVDTTALGIPMDKIAKIIRSQNASISGFANKLFMPEWVARYFIHITDVRAERLQEISDEDCLREGIIEERPEFYNLPEGPAKFCIPTMVTESQVYACRWFDAPREAYAALIDKINGRRTWDCNPFVWVYDYELCEKPTV